MLVVLFWTVLRPRLLGPIVELAVVSRVDLIRTLVASGHVASRFRTDIGAQITGIVVRVPVREGQTVRVGDTLIVLDDTESRALVVQADAQLQQATAQVRQLREFTLPAAQQTLVQARATLLSMEQGFARNLTAAGFDSEAARDEAQKNLDIARAEARSAELAVVTSQPSGSNATAVNAQLAQAKANRSAARTRDSYRAILAPRAGTLIARNVEVGDVAQIGKSLMSLSPTGAVSIEVLIDERNLGAVAVGQPALAAADAFPATRFAATVSFINPGIDLLRASVAMQLAVPNAPAFLRQDMTVSVDIETARHNAVLVVATTDIHDLRTQHPWVFVVRNKHARRLAISLGLVAAGHAEVLTGVVAGDSVIVGTAGSVTDGRRVRVQTAVASTAAAPAAGSAAVYTAP